MDANEPLPSRTYSPLKRFEHAVRTRALTWGGQSGLASGHRWRRPRSNSTSKPTFLKSYPSYPELPCRVFIPRPEASMPGLLPLYVDIHGGGFILGRPEVDDFYCAHLAETNGICVVAISHRKAPQWRFPTAVDDVSAIILSIIDSDSLPIDRSQVVVGGFSTGGTLALACVQTEYLKGRVKGVVAFSPLTDLSIPVVDKMSTVPANSEPDRLGKDFAELVQQAYVPPKTNLRDPLLSPIYAARSNLPRHIYLVGSELDMLFAEVERMANGLAVEEVGTRLGDEARWTKGTICFEKVKGVRHNFTHISEKAEKEVERKLVVDDLLNRIGVWLCDTVYSQEP